MMKRIPKQGKVPGGLVGLFLFFNIPPCLWAPWGPMGFKCPVGCCNWLAKGMFEVLDVAAITRQKTDEQEDTIRHANFGRPTFFVISQAVSHFPYMFFPDSTFHY